MAPLVYLKITLWLLWVAFTAFSLAAVYNTQVGWRLLRALASGGQQAQCGTVRQAPAVMALLSWCCGTKVQAGSAAGGS